ncbi:MAG: transcriptional regulator [Anaerolineaceae bacterium]|nr:transcriptional regulator [Anaerolineaceae bacterium]
MNEFQAFLDIDRMIHEPARMLIMSILNITEEVDFLYLLRETGLTRGNLSSHLSKLEEAGYIEIQKDFIGKKPQTVCSITSAGEQALSAYRKQVLWMMKKME